MKKLLIPVFLFCVVSYSQAQTKVKESDLRGEWKMVFDFDEEDLEEGIEDSFWLGSIVSGPMSGFVMSILEDIDIRMEFLDGGKLKISVEAFDDKETEYDRWRLTSKGELVIGDDDDDEVWMLDGKKLYQYERKGGHLERQEVYMVRK